MTSGRISSTLSWFNYLWPRVSVEWFRGHVYDLSCENFWSLVQMKWSPFICVVFKGFFSRTTRRLVPIQRWFNWLNPMEFEKLRNHLFNFLKLIHDTKSRNSFWFLRPIKLLFFSRTTNRIDSFYPFNAFLFFLSQ